MTNGNKYKTAEERYRKFLLFCNANNDDGSCVKCPLNNKAHKRLGCAYAWLELEAEEEKPMNCPFCGSQVKIMHMALASYYYFVQCANNTCSYSSRIMLCRDKSIAAHNRVCKSVAAFKESEVK